MTLIYFGAGWDANIIWKSPDSITRYVFVDALPDTPHYNPGQNGYPYAKDRPSFIRSISLAICRAGQLISYYEDGNKLTFIINDGRVIKTIYYYINTTVQQFVNNEANQDLLNSVLFYHEKGFNPIEYGLQVTKHLPNVKYEIGKNYMVYDRRFWFDPSINPLKPQPLNNF
jgi:hypothetical protein